MIDIKQYLAMNDGGLKTMLQAASSLVSKRPINCCVSYSSITVKTLMIELAGK